MNEVALGVSKTEQDLMSEINAIGGALIDAKDDSISTMDEHRFVAVFLPMFAGDEVQHYRDYGADINKWRMFAGSPFKEVRIVNSQGVEIFRVPPIFDDQAVKPLDGTGDAVGIPSIADMLARADMIAKQGPAAYETYMSNELSRRSFMFSQEGDETKYIQRWNEIFQRYNRPLIYLKGKSGQSNVTAENNERPIDFDSAEFDPF